MSYNLGVKWLSGCSEVGDHDVYSICYKLRKNANNQANSLWQNKCQKKHSLQFYFLFFICNASMSWSTMFIFSVKICMGFSIFDSILFLLKFILTLKEHQKIVNPFFNWHAFHARLSSPYRAWSYKKKKHKKIKASKKSLWEESTVKNRCLLILYFNPFR